MLLFRKTKIVFLVFLVSVYISSVSAYDATYYHSDLDGNSTRNGDIFRNADFSAASCDLDAIGTYMYLSKGNTGVVVDINDKIPTSTCKKYPNSIDLSQAAFGTFAPLSTGRIYDIQGYSLGSAPTKKNKGFLDTDIFGHLGIELDDDIPTIFYADQSYTFRGRVTAFPVPQTVIVSFISADNQKYTALAPVSPNGRFQIHTHLPKNNGDYAFIIASGNAFNTNKFANISIITPLSLPSLGTGTLAFDPKISQINDIPTIILPKGLLAHIEFKRNSKTIYSRSGVGSIVLDNFPVIRGLSQVFMSGSLLSTSSPLDQARSIDTIFSGSVYIEKNRKYIGAENIYLKKGRGRTMRFSFIVPESPKLYGHYYLTHPDGSVEKIHFPDAFLDENKMLVSGSPISRTISLRSSGVYKLELVKSNGEAYVNIPITQGKIWQISPLFDTRDTKKISDVNIVRSDVIQMLNVVRAEQNLSLLSEDTLLSAIAQAKVDDIIARGYEPAHIDIDGNNVYAFAIKNGFQPTLPIAENIAAGNLSHKELQGLLEESGSHRYTMVDTRFKKVGVGYGRKNGETYLIQIFGD